MAHTHKHKWTRACALRQAMALDPPPRMVWGEPHKSLGSLQSKVTHAGRHADGEIPLITVSHKSSPP